MSFAEMIRLHPIIDIGVGDVGRGGAGDLQNMLDLTPWSALDGLGQGVNERVRGVKFIL